MVEVLCVDTAIPNELIAGINDESRLTFFTPVLLSKEAFAQVNHQGNTVLHILFASPLAAYPPFNYVRSLLLFERNESLSKALAVRNQQQLTAIEMFFSHRKDLTALPNHELGALLALVEVERKLQITPLKANLPMIVKHLRKQHKATWTGAEQCHIMLASYYQCPLALVLSIK
ncbi:hypothetical protein ACFOEE_07060 [Pseudoalteromonas fenneropenaei]|uniref:DUF4123 domain-containing protein n=1 Tax=Pseudoalteromonas fenneropenaei TaxID=1737459 RepID=A0ABV7CI86_9GAMM